MPTITDVITTPDGTADAYFGLGYAHAQDRLWQMEMNRRIGMKMVDEGGKG